MTRFKQIILSFLSIFALLTSNLGAMTTQGTQILDSQGNAIELKGVNWFGFNNQSTMVDGLWGGPNSIAFDFATVVYRMELLGFNAIRLPFSFQDLFNLAPKNYAQGCTIATQSQIQASVTNPSVPVPAGDTIPPMVAPPQRQANTCNDYLPNDTTLNRFLWVVNFFAKNGFYVLIDNHFREDQTVLQSQQQWLQYWVQLVTAISKDPVSRDRLMIDLLNEPDNYGVRWEASGNLPALKDLYLSAMDALYQVNPNALFFIEGTGQGGIGANWGDGFATDPTLITQNGLSDPNPFFKALMTKPYLNQVVISPHVYPPSVTGASSNYAGPGLWNRLSESFGYLTQKGYCTQSQPCKVFPVAIGEFGSRFTQSTDIQSMNDIALYLNNTGNAADGKHQTIPNWFFWAWNADSGDTGGIVADNWLDIIWTKINYLTNIALSPWYLGPPTPVKTGTLCISVNPVNGLTKDQLQPISVGNQTFSFTDFNQPVCATIPVGTYTITPPTIQTSTQQFTANAQTVTVADGESTTLTITYTATPLPPVNANLQAKVQLGTPWMESGVTKNVINLYISNQGSNAVKAPWTIKLANSSYLDVSSAWNLAVTSVKSGVITAVAQSDWESLLPNNGNVVNVGMIISSSSNNFLPTSITINDMQVTITQ